MASHKVTLTIPQSLHQEVKRLIKAGYYANLAELARAGIRKEMKELYMANPALALETDGLLYLRRLEEIRQIIREAGGINKTEEEALEDLRQIREEVWRERAEALRRIEANSLRDAGQNVVTTHTG
jgi:Arc/MetJ-type ribon-helix-helix transcriptional regulator